MFGLAMALAGLIFGATTAFAQLQEALNRSWKVRSESGGISGFIVKRLLSFAIVILIAVLILASVVLNAWTASVGNVFGAPGWIIEALSFAVSFLLLFALFAIIFKYFPDAEVNWADVKVGALVTAALFEIGRFLLATLPWHDRYREHVWGSRFAGTDPPVCVLLLDARAVRCRVHASVGQIDGQEVHASRGAVPNVRAPSP